MPTLTHRRSLAPLWLLVFGLAALLALVGIGAVQRTTALFALGAAPNPYFLPAQGWLLYVLTPLATLATALYLMAPGLALAACTGARKGPAVWLLTGFGWTLILMTATISLFQITTGIVAEGVLFWKLAGLTGLAMLALLAWRLERGVEPAFDPRAHWRELGTCALIFLACLILLAPKFYWENFSPDGSGALQFARLFIHTLWPFWMPEAGSIQQAPSLSMVLFVLPESWLVRLWGETEFAVRAPYLLYLAMVYPVLTALIGWQRPDRPGPVTALLIIGALAVYSLSIIYSGGYHPYFGDSPMPAARETLAIALFMGFLLAFADRQPALMLPVGLMASLTIPSGGLWTGLVLIAALLVWRRESGGRIAWTLATIVLILGFSAIVPRFGALFSLPYPQESEFGVRAIVNRLRYVVFDDWQRFAFLLVPCGILPALALFTWARQDRLSRLVTLVTAMYFLFFYLQGYRVLLHQFAPIMLAPLVVFWRLPRPQGQTGDWMLKGATAACLVASLWLSWPREMRLHSHDRMIGQMIETSGPRYTTAERGPGDRFRGFSPAAIDTAHVLLAKLFPYGYGNTDAAERFFGGPLVWWFYSEFDKPADQIINYRLKPMDQATPEDGTEIATHDGYGLYVKDMDLWAAHAATRLPTDTGAPIFAIRQERIYSNGSNETGVHVFDLVKIVRSILGQ